MVMAMETLNMQSHRATFLFVLKIYRRH